MGSTSSFTWFPKLKATSSEDLFLGGSFVHSAAWLPSSAPQWELSPCVLLSVLTVSTAGPWTPTRLTQENNFQSVSNARQLDGSGTHKTANWEEHPTGPRLPSETGEISGLLRGTGTQTSPTPALLQDPVGVSGRHDNWVLSFVWPRNSDRR